MNIIILHIFRRKRTESTQSRQAAPNSKVTIEGVLGGYSSKISPLSARVPRLGGGGCCSGAHPARQGAHG